MSPKTERFEMRLDPQILERVDVWRGGQSDVPSRAEAIRRLVEHGLEQSSPENFQLSQSERLMTWLMTEVLKNQKGYENKDTIDLIQQSIYGGHFWALKWELTGILHDHTDSRSAVSLVVDVLDMWAFIERAYKSFTPADRLRIEKEVGPWAKDPEFIGFDGNNEGEYMGIAKFLVDKLGRFSDFKGRTLNSHAPRVDRYRAMSALFEPMRVNLIGRELSVDEIIVLMKRS